MAIKQNLQLKRQPGKFSSIVRDQALHTSWAAKMKMKQEIASARQAEAERKAARAAELEVRSIYCKCN